MFECSVLPVHTLNPDPGSDRALSAHAPQRRVCSAHDVLGPEPCWVFSLGSNGQCGFEADVRRRYPHCRIDVYDPTISEQTAGKVAAKTEVRADAFALMPTKPILILADISDGPAPTSDADSHPSQPRPYLSSLCGVT